MLHSRVVVYSKARWSQSQVRFSRLIDFIYYLSILDIASIRFILKIAITNVSEYTEWETNRKWSKYLWCRQFGDSMPWVWKTVEFHRSLSGMLYCKLVYLSFEIGWAFWLFLDCTWKVDSVPSKRPSRRCLSPLQEVSIPILFTARGTILRDREFTFFRRRILVLRLIQKRSGDRQIQYMQKLIILQMNQRKGQRSFILMIQ